MSTSTPPAERALLWVPPNPQLPTSGAVRDGIYQWQPSNPHSWLVRGSGLEFRIAIQRGLLDSDNPDLGAVGRRDANDRPRWAVLVDRTVNSLRRPAIDAWLGRFDVEASVKAIRADEAVKTLETVNEVLHWLNDLELRRRDSLLVIGGGVLLDVGNLAANLTMRGIRVWNVPTTTVGLCDAGVGVKCGVNHVRRDGRRKKNAIGTYYAVELALMDPTFLTTLPERHVANGVAEMVKVGLFHSPALFTQLERHGRELVRGRFQTLGVIPENTLALAIQGTLEGLQPHLLEDVLDRWLDGGHTFGPTLEMAAPSMLHGESVAIDMVLSAVIAERRGMLDAADCARLIALLRKLRLPVTDPALTRALAANALHASTLHRDGEQRLPLPRGIGACEFVNDLRLPELNRAVDRAHELASATAHVPDDEEES